MTDKKSPVVIDLTEIDTIAGKNWLRDPRRHTDSAKMQAIRAKHKAKHDSEQKAVKEMQEALRRTDKLGERLNKLDEK